MNDADIDTLSADGAQEKLRKFTPSNEYRRYVCKVMRDAYDKDMGSVQLTVTALGPIDARHIAWDRAYQMGMKQHVVVRVVLE
jgi:hypothetical protein